MSRARNNEKSGYHCLLIAKRMKALMSKASWVVVAGEWPTTNSSAAVIVPSPRPPSTDVRQNICTRAREHAHHVRAGSVQTLRARHSLSVGTNYLITFGVDS